MPSAPETYLARHGLNAAGLRRAGAGFSNQVWLTDTAVLRVGSETDHGREAAVALGALAAGVRTARPLHWSGRYSVWERLPGRMPGPAELTPAFWDAVLDDLERLHAAPPEPYRRRPTEHWLEGEGLVSATQGVAGWSSAERVALRRVLCTPYPLTAPLFIHGDVYRHNLLADPQGRYAGLLDWGNAGWATLEHEGAVLDDPTPALERFRGRLDPGLLWRVRLALLLRVMLAGRGDEGEVRGVLARLQDH